MLAYYMSHVYIVIVYWNLHMYSEAMVFSFGVLVQDSWELELVPLVCCYPTDTIVKLST
jgi:hypothetical protein